LKIATYVTVFFLLLLVLICSRGLGSFSNINNPKINESIDKMKARVEAIDEFLDTGKLENLTGDKTDNSNQSTIILFSQNYSEINNIPSNIFLDKIENTTTLDNAYSTIYGKEKSEIFLDNTSKELVYATTRNSNDSSTPLANHADERLKKGSLYICNFTPMVKCTYEISMGISTDDPQNYIEVYSPGSKLVIRKIDDNTVLKSYFQDASGNMKSKTITIGNADKSNLKIIFDGENKTNTIVAEDGSSITTPFCKLDRQELPYTDFSNGYIKFISFINGNGKYLNIDFSSITQKADRKLITPIGDSKLTAYGLDGPFPKNKTGQGIDYLNIKGDRGTIWFDMGSIAACNQTDLDYLRYLVTNDSWEVGIHFSKGLNSLSPDEANKTIDTEYEYIYEKIGEKPTSWCSLQNKDNVTQAIYAYNKYGMYWRNGDSGVEAEELIGNLDDDTWSWWELASHAGMTYPVFTHQTDKDPAIKYSISSSKLKDWVDNYYSNNISIVPFYEYCLINRNTHDAYFDNISSNETLTKFNAHTNGFKSLINVDVSAGNNTRVYDDITGKHLGFKVEADKSITFWAENKHTYNVYGSIPK